MVEIETKFWGRIRVPEHKIITFEKGILGFEEYKKYVLIETKGGIFYWLQSMENPEICFLLIRPKVFKEDYELDVYLEDLEVIEAESLEEVIDFAIVTFSMDAWNVSANLLGPILINPKNMKGVQAISKKEYGTKHYILKELEKSRSNVFKLFKEYLSNFEYLTSTLT